MMHRGNSWDYKIRPKKCGIIYTVYSAFSGAMVGSREEDNPRHIVIFIATNNI
jgi:hypothetical protein